MNIFSFFQPQQNQSELDDDWLARTVPGYNELEDVDEDIFSDEYFRQDDEYFQFCKERDDDNDDDFNFDDFLSPNWGARQ